jgi:hypothetical protein
MKINDLGKSVLNEMPKGEGESAHDAIPSLAHDLAFDAGQGGSMGALISPTPELGQSAYQMPTVPDGKKTAR